MNGIPIAARTGRTAEVTSAANQTIAKIALASRTAVLASCRASPHGAPSQKRLGLLSGKGGQR